MRPKKIDFTSQFVKIAILVAACLAVACPNTASATTAFIQLYEINSGHSVCSSLCTNTYTNSGSAVLPGFSQTGSGGLTFINASGAVSPSSILGSASGNVGVELDLGVDDNYTVMGTASGPFAITATLHAVGTFDTVPAGPFQEIVGGTATARIGTYGTLTLPSGPYAVVTEFDPAAHANASATFTNAPAQPFDITATYTTMVSVGDTFDLAYELALSFALGTIDASHTATLAFATPSGIYLAAGSGSLFGDVPTVVDGTTPVPASLPLFVTGLGALGFLGWRRKRKI